MQKKFKEWGTEIILSIFVIIGLIYILIPQNKTTKTLPKTTFDLLSKKIQNKKCVIKMPKNNTTIQVVGHNNGLQFINNKIKILYFKKTLYIKNNKDKLGLKIDVNLKNQNKVISLLGFSNPIKPNDCKKNSKPFFKNENLIKNYINITPFIK